MSSNKGWKKIARAQIREVVEGLIGRNGHPRKDTGDYGRGKCHRLLRHLLIARMGSGRAVEVSTGGDLQERTNMLDVHG